MGNSKIKNLGAPATYENDAAVNVGFFNSEVNASNQNLSAQITAAYKKYVAESHVTSSGHAGNAFSYLMEDAGESSLENNTSVTGIVPFDASIHQMNKNAYRLALVKDSGSDDYRSRIGINLGSLPIGYYTLVCEFFPVVMSNVSVTALGTTISINSQTTKTFPTYTKTLVQFHRWNSTPPQFIYLDLHGRASDGGSRVLAHMVVYGGKGYVPNVPSSVFDQVLVVDNGRMEMQTDFDLHGHRLLNNGQNVFSFDSSGTAIFLSPVGAPYFKTHEFIRGSIITTTEIAFVFAGHASYFQIPYSDQIEGIYLFYADRTLASYPRIATKLNYEPNTATYSSQIVSQNINSPRTGRNQYVEITTSGNVLYHLRIDVVIPKTTILATIQAKRVS